MNALPTYCFKYRDTGVEFEKFMGISARDVYLKENPNVESMFSGAPMICDPVRVGARKKDSGFKDVLQKIDQRTAGSVLKYNNSW